MKAEAHWRRLAVPGATSLAIVGIAPVLSELRGALAAVFPRSFVPLVSVGFVAVLAGAAVLAARHIRRRRLPRFLGLATAAGLVALQVLAFARDDAQVSAIERLHILEYGLLALLFYWAL